MEFSSLDMNHMCKEVSSLFSLPADSSTVGNEPIDHARKYSDCKEHSQMCCNLLWGCPWLGVQQWYYEKNKTKPRKTGENKSFPLDQEKLGKTDLSLLTKKN